MVDRHKGSSRESSIHLLRHSLHKIGKTTKEIAEMHHVKESSVLRSIAIVDAYRLTNTTELLNASIVDTVLKSKKKVDKALDDALSSTIVGKQGKDVPNHDVRMKAIAEVRQLAQAVQPKASGSRSGTTVLVNQQSGVHTAPPTAESRFVGYEERIRKIRSRVEQHNQLPPPESVAAPLGEDELDVGEGEVVEPQHTSG